RGLRPSPHFSRVPVTAGNLWETAMRPLDSARFARLESQRWTAVRQVQVPAPSVPQGWPELWRLASPFSSFPPFSSSWRISFLLPPFSYQLSSMTSSSFLMLSSFSFSFRLFSLFSSCSISFKVVEQKKPGPAGPDYPTADRGFPAPAC